MKQIILFYSYSGRTKILAGMKALELNADIEEITEVKKMSVIKAYVVGGFYALRRKRVKINPIKANLSDYEQIIIMVPVWAGNPAPAFNSIKRLIPSGKKIELIMISAGGGTKKSAEKTKEFFINRGCEVTGYTDVNAHKK